MIRLRPINTEQTFSIIPSSYASADLDSASISLIENGTNNSENNVTFTYAESSNGNFIEISMTPTITFEEDQIYTFELKTSNDVYYRDLIYITSETSKKDVFTLPDIYEEHSTGENEYIVL